MHYKIYASVGLMKRIYFKVGILCFLILLIGIGSYFFLNYRRAVYIKSLHLLGQFFKRVTANVNTTPTGALPVEVLADKTVLKGTISEPYIEVVSIENPILKKSSYKFDYARFHNKQFRKLREKYKLAEIIGDESPDFEQLLQLNNWVYHRWRYGKTDPDLDFYQFNALKLLEQAARGRKYVCAEYTTVLVQICLSLGFTARPVYLERPFRTEEEHRKAVIPTIETVRKRPRRTPNRRWGGGHLVAEAWLESLQKWVVLDPTKNRYYSNLSGEPLNAIEIHKLLTENALDKIKLVQGPDSQRDYLTPNSYQFKEFMFLFWSVNVIMGNDYFDKIYYQLDPYHKWSTYKAHQHFYDDYTAEHPGFVHTGNIDDFYWTLNRVQLYFNKVSRDTFRIYFDTITPDFDHFLIHVNTQETTCEQNYFLWKLTPGENYFKVQSVNSLGHTGKPSYITVSYSQHS